MSQTFIKLHQLGFSEYEAKAYVSLLTANPVTGYELSKNSTVPRSMIYQTLQRLIDKGAALAIMGQPVRYVPINPEELLGRLQTNYNSLVDDLRQELSQLEHSSAYSYFWNIKSYPLIIDKAREMITTAKESLYLSGFSEEIHEIKSDLLELAKRGVKLEILTRGNPDLSVQNIYAYQTITDIEHKKTDRWLILVADMQEVMIGEGLQNPDCIAVWTKNNSLITICLRHIKYEIFMAQKFNQIRTWD